MSWWNSQLKIQVPNRDWIRDVSNSTQFTPDMWRLERYEYQNVFIPDELMERFGKTSALGEDAERRCAAFTKEKFSFFQKNLGKATMAIPMVEAFESAPLACIRGEVYKVRPRQFIALDNYRANGLYFERKRVKLVVPYRKVGFINEKAQYEAQHNVELSKAVITTPTMYHELKAWMYVGVPDYWNSILKSGAKISVTTNGEKHTTRINDQGTFSPVERYIPYNPVLETYYYFTNRTNDNIFNNGKTRSVL